MNAIVRVKIANLSPLYSSADGRVMEVSLPAAPWDTPYVPPPKPPEDTPETKADVVLRYIRDNGGADHVTAARELQITQASFFHSIKTLQRRGVIRTERGAAGKRSRYHVKENA
jgi:hypothetical protein